jgi:hypothetical protein
MPGVTIDDRDARPAPYIARPKFSSFLLMFRTSMAVCPRYGLTIVPVYVLAAVSREHLCAEPFFVLLVFILRTRSFIDSVALRIQG